MHGVCTLQYSIVDNDGHHSQFCDKLRTKVNGLGTLSSQARMGYKDVFDFDDHVKELLHGLRPTVTENIRVLQFKYNQQVVGLTYCWFRLEPTRSASSLPPTHTIHKVETIDPSEENEDEESLPLLSDIYPRLFIIGVRKIPAITLSMPFLDLFFNLLPHIAEQEHVRLIAIVNPLAIVDQKAAQCGWLQSELYCGQGLLCESGGGFNYCRCKIVQPDR